MLLNSICQKIFINPAKGRKFDVKVQCIHLNSDIQYPVTITREKLEDAFVSWEKKTLKRQRKKKEILKNS